jgi:hypothetical protein
MNSALTIVAGNDVARAFRQSAAPVIAKAMSVRDFSMYRIFGVRKLLPITVFTIHAVK